VLKIDRTFIAGIGDSEESDALVHTLIQLGKVLGLETVAEGVETSDQRSRLKTANVDVGQGFLFARPLASADAEKFFARWATTRERTQSRGIEQQELNAGCPRPINRQVQNSRAVSSCSQGQRLPSFPIQWRAKRRRF